METDPKAAADRWLAPISGASPAGQDQRYEPGREALKEQMSGVGSAAIDWQAYSSDAEKLLVSGGKDLLIACYLAYASFQTDGIRGLAAGLALVAGMLDRYWETCFPAVKKARARANAIAWLVERVAPELTDAAGADDPQALPDLQRETAHLQQAVSARFEQGAIDLVPLGDAIKKMSGSLGVPQGSGAAAQATSAPQTETRPQEPEAPAADPRALRVAELKQGFAKPIPGDSPSGEDARYDDDYEAVRAEVDKLGRADANEVDWEKVAEKSRTLLTDRTKDLRVACYFAAAAYQQEGLAGLIEGLAAVTAIAETYWDNGYPKGRARPNTVKWMVERLESLRDFHPEPDHEQDIETLELAVQELAQLIQEKFPPPAPSLRKLAEAVDQVKRSLRVEPPPPPPPPPPKLPEGTGKVEQPSSGVGSKTQVGASPMPQVVAPKLDEPAPPPTDPAQITEYLRTIGAALHKASRALFKTSPQSALAYRLARLGLYLHLQEAPPAMNGNATAVPAPLGNRAQQFKTLVTAKNWAVLLDEAESLLPRSRLWLDLHRYVAMALAGLGHDDARDAVVEETGSVVKRMPELLERAFANGEPFADRQTQEWLRAEALNTAPSAGPALGGNGSSSALDEQLDDARKLALGGKLEEALAKLSAVADSEGTVGRDRFRAKLAMAEACVAGGSQALAEGIYAGLNAEIARFQLEEWEPNLAEACYRGRYEALMAMAVDGTKPPQELAEVYRQLCRVSPAAALKLGKPKT